MVRFKRSGHTIYRNGEKKNMKSLDKIVYKENEEIVSYGSKQKKIELNTEKKKKKNKWK